MLLPRLKTTDGSESLISVDAVCVDVDGAGADVDVVDAVDPDEEDPPPQLVQMASVEITRRADLS